MDPITITLGAIAGTAMVAAFTGHLRAENAKRELLEEKAKKQFGANRLRGVTTTHRRTVDAVTTQGWNKIEDDVVAYKYTANAIAVLVIPEGAMVYRHHEKKHSKYRANAVYVDKLITDVSNGKVETTTHDFGNRTSDYVYVAGEINTPEEQFSERPSICESGIHFYADVETACLKPYDMDVSAREMKRLGYR